MCEIARNLIPDSTHTCVSLELGDLGSGLVWVISVYEGASLGAAPMADPWHSYFCLRKMLLSVLG